MALSNSRRAYSRDPELMGAQGLPALLLAALQQQRVPAATGGAQLRDRRRPLIGPEDEEEEPPPVRQLARSLLSPSGQELGEPEIDEAPEIAGSDVPRGVLPPRPIEAGWRGIPFPRRFSLPLPGAPMPWERRAEEGPQYPWVEPPWLRPAWKRLREYFGDEPLKREDAGDTGNGGNNNSNAEEEEKKRKQAEFCLEEIRAARKICTDSYVAGWKSSYDTGPYKKPDKKRWTIQDCMKGHIAEICKGNEVDWGKQGRPPELDELDKLEESEKPDSSVESDEPKKPKQVKRYNLRPSGKKKKKKK